MTSGTVAETGTQARLAAGADVGAVLKALADAKRLRIVALLAGGERCVCTLQDELALGQSLLSHHLRCLKEAGVVRDRRAGRWVHYALEPGALALVEAWLAAVRAVSVSAVDGGDACVAR